MSGGAIYRAPLCPEGRPPEVTALKTRNIRLGVQYAVRVPGLPSPRPAAVVAVSMTTLWVRCVRYRREELLQVEARHVVAPWEEYAEGLEARRQERLDRRATRNA